MHKLILCLIIGCLMTGCQRIENLESILNLENNIQLETIFKNNCEYDMDIYYQNENNRLYLNCVDNIDISDGQTKKTLKEYIDKEDVDLNDLLKKITSNLSSDTNNENDIYKDEKIMLVSCSSVDGDKKDIIIGKSKNDYDIKKFCLPPQHTLKVTAIITELYEDDMIVESVNDSKDKYNITRISTFEKNFFENLMVGTIITFSYNGSKDLTDPPKIRATDIKIIK